MLQDIVTSEIIDHQFTLIACKHLAELLLDELKTYGEQEVVDELQVILQTMQEIAQEQHMFPIMIEALLLQAQIVLLEGSDFKQSNTKK